MPCSSSMTACDLTTPKRLPQHYNSSRGSTKLTGRAGNEQIRRYALSPLTELPDSRRSFAPGSRRTPLTFLLIGAIGVELLLARIGSGDDRIAQDKLWGECQLALRD